MKRFMEELEATRNTVTRDFEYLRDTLGAPLEYVQPGMITSRLAPLKDKIRQLLGDQATMPKASASASTSSPSRPAWPHTGSSTNPCRQTTELQLQRTQQRRQHPSAGVNVTRKKSRSSPHAWGCFCDGSKRSRSGSARPFLRTRGDEPATAHRCASWIHRSPPDTFSGHRLWPSLGGKKRSIDSASERRMIVSYICYDRSISHEHAPENHHAD
jgi:hypothetical protein